MEWFLQHQINELKHRMSNLKEKIVKYELMREAENEDFQKGIYAGMVIILESELWRTEQELQSFKRIVEEKERTA